MSLGRKAPKCPVMTVAELIAVASEAYADPVYGAPWADELCARAQVGARQLRRWLNEETRIPGSIASMLRAHALCRKHGLEIP